MTFSHNMVLILLNIVVILVCIFIYTTVNLLNKNEKLEDVISAQQQYVDKLSEIGDFSITKTKIKKDNLTVSYSIN